MPTILSDLNHLNSQSQLFSHGAIFKLRAYVNPFHLVLKVLKVLKKDVMLAAGPLQTQYAERVREAEHGVFTPLVFASTGGMARECTIFFKRIADTLSDKKQISFSQIMYLIRCRISFALLCSAVWAIRGSRSSRWPVDCGIDFDRAITEGQL